MEASTVLNFLNMLWPLLIGFVGVIAYIVKMNVEISVLKEKVATLFNLHNTNKKE